MAMNDFNISLLAGLDGTKSRNKLNQDIDAIKRTLKELELKAKLDPNQVRALENQLNSLKVNLSNVSFDQNSLNNLVSQINNSLQGIKLQIPNLNTSNVGNQAKQAGQQIGKLISDGAEQAIKNVSSKVIGNGFTVSKQMSNKVQTELESIVKDWTNGKGKISSITIDTKTNFDNKQLENIEQLKSATVKYSDELGRVITKTLQWKQIGETTTNGKTEEIKGWVESASSYKASIDSANRATDSFINKQTQAVSNLKNTLSTIESKFNDPGATKHLTDTTHISDVQNKIAEVNNAITTLQNSNKSTFTQAKTDVEKLITELNNLITKYQNAEYAATSLRTKDIQTIKIDEGNNLNAFVQKMEQSGHYTDDLKQKVSTLRTQLNGVFDANTLTAYLNGLSNIQSEFKAVDATAKTVEKSTKLQTNIDAEKKVLQVYTNQLKDAGVLTGDVKTKIQEMFHSLSKVGSQSGLTTWRAELKGVKAETDAVLKSVQKTTDDSNLEKLNADIRTLTNNLNNFSSNNTGFNTFKIDINGVEVSLDSLMQKLSTINNTSDLNTIRSQAEALKTSFTQLQEVNKIQLQLDTGAYQSKVDSLIARTNQWVDANGNARISTESLKTALDNLSVAQNNLNSSGGNTVANQQALIAAEEALNVEVKKVQSSVTSMNATMAKSTAVDALRQKVQMFYDTNSKAHWKWGKDLKSIMTQLASGAEVPITKMRQLEQEFIRIQNSARQAGKLGLSFFDTIKQGISKFSYWTSSTFLVMKTITSIKSAVSSVKELDTALVDLRKTTKMSASELENFYYKSNDVAKQMGVTTKEIITQAAAWSRLGFNTAESATEMAKLSAQFKMISPGMTLDEATDGLVSVMKAYGIEVNDVLDGIMSKINIIGNNKALNNSDIVDFLTRSSAAMASANNSLEETIALGEAAVEITRDASNAGQVLKTTSMRIRGIDEETETYSEDLEILKGKIADLTKTAKTPGGISLFTDETKQTYKSTYQILEEISNIWSDLTDKNQAQLLEVLAGKRNGQALAAIISNFDSARESMDLMANSAGNANAEMAIAMDSIEYKLNKLKETFTGVAQNLFKRDDMKSVVDFFTSIGKAIESVTEKLGLFGSIGIGAGLFAGIKNVGQVKMWTCLIYAYPC